jgi:hypothetical protein
MEVGASQVPMSFSCWIFQGKRNFFRERISLRRVNFLERGRVLREVTVDWKAASSGKRQGRNLLRKATVGGSRLVPGKLRQLDLSSEGDGSWRELGADELLLPDLFTEMELVAQEDLSSESDFYVRREISTGTEFSVGEDLSSESEFLIESEVSTEKELFSGDDPSSEGEFSVKSELSIEKGWSSGRTRYSGELRQPSRSSER